MDETPRSMFIKSAWLLLILFVGGMAAILYYAEQGERGWMIFWWLVVLTGIPSGCLIAFQAIASNVNRSPMNIYTTVALPYITFVFVGATLLIVGVI